MEYGGLDLGGLDVWRLEGLESGGLDLGGLDVGGWKDWKSEDVEVWRSGYCGIWTAQGPKRRP